MKPRERMLSTLLLIFHGATSGADCYTSIKQTDSLSEGGDTLREEHKSRHRAKPHGLSSPFSTGGNDFLPNTSLNSTGSSLASVAPHDGPGVSHEMHHAWKVHSPQLSNAPTLSAPGSDLALASLPHSRNAVTETPEVETGAVKVGEATQSLVQVGGIFDIFTSLFVSENPNEFVAGNKGSYCDFSRKEKDDYPWACKCDTVDYVKWKDKKLVSVRCNTPPDNSLEFVQAYCNPQNSALPSFRPMGRQVGLFVAMSVVLIAFFAIG